ncbi:Imm50 family immunity protein [Streptomyces sp. NPDC015131]|uniref:Imm50 family immunity protein n=1 Tax=Streptomyces sp. NPDC015131 TaxID=3364941 RepID=UPI0036FD35F3
MTGDITWVNSHDLLDLYGRLPPLGSLDLRSVNLSWQGPTVTLRVDLPTFPSTVPPEWKDADVDTIQCHLQFLAVEDFSLALWEPPVRSASLRAQALDTADRRIHVRVTGARVALDFTSTEAVKVGHVSAFKIGPDGSDEGRHLFVRRLDRMRHESIPSTEERTFYGRI